MSKIQVIDGKLSCEKGTDVTQPPPTLRHLASVRLFKTRVLWWRLATNGVGKQSVVLPSPL